MWQKLARKLNEIAKHIANHNQPPHSVRHQIDCPAERELAKARVDIAHEVRLAREAEDSMELHVAKAGKKGEREIAKHTANHNQPRHSVGHQNDCPADTNDPHGQVCPNNLAGSSTATAASGLKNTTNTAGAPPKNNQLLPPDFNIFTSK